jgi:hypothetical protein
MLPRMPDETIELRIGAEVDSDLGWPIRMIRQRLFARKSNHNTKSLVADLLLDMPDLSNDWGMLKFLVTNHHNTFPLYSKGCKPCIKCLTINMDSRVGRLII